MYIDSKKITPENIQFSILEIMPEDMKLLRTSIENQYYTMMKSKAISILAERDSTIFDKHITRAEKIMKMIDAQLKLTI